MPTSHDVRANVVTAIYAFAEHQHRRKRPETLLARRLIRNATRLSVLGIQYDDYYKLGAYLTKCGLCEHMHHTCTGRWLTIEHVITSVQAHPADLPRLSRRS